MPRKTATRQKKTSGEGNIGVMLLIVIAAALLYFLVSINTPTVPGAHLMTSTVNTSAIPIPVASLNVSFNVTNDEVTGRYGYWALANYTRTVRAYRDPSGSYLLFVTVYGTWSTFAGALSPNGNNTFEGSNATGSFVLDYGAAVGNATLNTSAQLMGYIGSFDSNGSASDILKRTYANQTGTANNFWLHRYFGVSNVSILSYYSQFSYGKQKYSIIFNGTEANVTGNIVT